MHLTDQPLQHYMNDIDILCHGCRQSMRKYQYHLPYQLPYHLPYHLPYQLPFLLVKGAYQESVNAGTGKLSSCSIPRELVSQ